MAPPPKWRWRIKLQGRILPESSSAAAAGRVFFVPHNSSTASSNNKREIASTYRLCGKVPVQNWRRERGMWTSGGEKLNNFMIANWVIVLLMRGDPPGQFTFWKLNLLIYVVLHRTHPPHSPICQRRPSYRTQRRLLNTEHPRLLSSFPIRRLEDVNKNPIDEWRSLRNKSWNDGVSSAESRNSIWRPLPLSRPVPSPLLER